MHIASGDLWAGAEAMLYELARAQNADRRLKITVVTLNPGLLADRLMGIGCETYVLDERNMSVLELVLRVRRHILKIRPEIIHSHRIKEDIIGALGAAGCGVLGLVRTVHGRDETPHQSRGLIYKIKKFAHWIIVRRLYKLSVAVSEDLRREMSNDGIFGRTEFVPNGLRASSDSIRDRLTARSAQLSQRSFMNIGFVGRLVSVKRCDLFLETAAELTRRHPGKYKFRVIGDGPLREDLTAYAASLGLSDALTFIGHSPSMTYEYNQINILVMSSDNEGLPMTVLEAMSALIPVVASAVGEIPALLQAGRNGSLVYEQSAAAYSDAIEKISCRPRFLKMQIRGRRHVEANYGIQISNERYLQVYRRAMS